MNILIINQQGKSELKTGITGIPRVGDRIDVFYEPLPTVTSVVWYPSRERMNALHASTNIDVLITVR